MAANNEILINYQHIDYIGQIYIPPNRIPFVKQADEDLEIERYDVFFAGGNKLTLFNQLPINDYELSKFVPRDDLVKKWKGRNNKTHIEFRM